MRAGFFYQPVVLVFLVAQAFAGQFVLFPKASQLRSPDGRFVVRDLARDASAAELQNTFRTLWLLETATGRSRKLCDYVGTSAVTWTDDDFIVVTQYLNKKTSRALIFSATVPERDIMLDVRTLTHIVAPNLRAALRENDHVFVEASRVEGATLYLRVWGYGTHDPDGFRWQCEYGLSAGTVACREQQPPK
jgi:hypothetical protein